MRRLTALAGVAVVIIGLGAFNYFRPIPAVAANPALPARLRAPGTPPQLPWPQVGGAAVAVQGLGEVGAHGADVSHSIASTAKVMTALVVLQDHPLALGQAGPALTITAADQQDYLAKLAQDESVVPVVAGESLTEYQLMEGLLIPSGNNLADLLARWDAGSVGAFVAKMNAAAARLGMSRTHYTDPSGFSPDTVSTADDLLKLAPLAMATPVLAGIVAMPQATLPVAGTVYNVDYTLGQDGIVGIKTGSSPAAGACFMFAARYRVGGLSALLFGVVVYQPDLDAAFAASRRLITAMQPALEALPVVRPGERVGTYNAPWREVVPALAAGGISLLAWPGMPLAVTTRLRQLQAPVADGTSVGDVSVGLGTFRESVAVVTAAPLYAPGREWRLLRTNLFGA